MTAEPGVFRKASILKVGSTLPTTAVCQALTTRQGRKEVCGAQAWVEVEFNNTTVRDDGQEIMTRDGLDFCAHCYAQHELELLMIAARVIDHRDELYRLERR